jgi:hypothetical protein
MKAYLITTGGLFGLLAAVHLVATVDHAQRLMDDPWFIVEGPGLGVLAGALAFWAWRLVRRAAPDS